MYHYPHQHSHSPSANRVFIDTEGRPHDPDYISHIFQDAELAARRRAKGKARRLSQTGLIQDSESDSDMDSDDELAMPPPMTHHFSSTSDPFRSRRSFTNPPSPHGAYHNYYSPPSPIVSKSSPYPSTPAAQRAFGQPPVIVHRRYRSTTTSTAASSTLSPITPLSPSGSYSPHSPSWQLENSDCGHDDAAAGHSPTCDRWSMRRRRTMTDDDETKEKGPRRVLKKRWTDALDEQSETENAEAAEDPEDCAPTCSEAIRQQWQSLVLRFTLSTHRAKRRLRPRNDESLLNEKFGT